MATPYPSSYIVSLPDFHPGREHLPYDLFVWVDGNIAIQRNTVVSLEALELELPIPNRRCQHVVIEIQTPCGNYYRDFQFDPTFAYLRRGDLDADSEAVCQSELKPAATPDEMPSYPAKERQWRTLIDRKYKALVTLIASSRRIPGTNLADVRFDVRSDEPINPVVSRIEVIPETKEEMPVMYYSQWTLLPDLRKSYAVYSEERMGLDDSCTAWVKGSPYLRLKHTIGMQDACVCVLAKAHNLHFSSCLTASERTGALAKPGAVAAVSDGVAETPGAISAAVVSSLSVSDSVSETQGIVSAAAVSALSVQDDTSAVKRGSVSVVSALTAQDDTSAVKRGSVSVISALTAADRAEPIRSAVRTSRITDSMHTAEQAADGIMQVYDGLQMESECWNGNDALAVSVLDAADTAAAIRKDAVSVVSAMSAADTGEGGLTSLHRVMPVSRLAVASDSSSELRGDVHFAETVDEISVGENNPVYKSWFDDSMTAIYRLPANAEVRLTIQTRIAPVYMVVFFQPPRTGPVVYASQVGEYGWYKSIKGWESTNSNTKTIPSVATLRLHFTLPAGWNSLTLSVFTESGVDYQNYAGLLCGNLDTSLMDKLPLPNSSVALSTLGDTEFVHSWYSNKGGDVTYSDIPPGEHFIDLVYQYRGVGDWRGNLISPVTNKAFLFEVRGPNGEVIPVVAAGTAEASEKNTIDVVIIDAVVSKPIISAKKLVPQSVSVEELIGAETDISKTGNMPMTSVSAIEEIGVLSETEMSITSKPPLPPAWEYAIISGQWQKVGDHWESTNQGVSSSSSKMRLTFNLPFGWQEITLRIGVSTEGSNYDGLLCGKLDQVLPSYEEFDGFYDRRFSGYRDTYPSVFQEGYNYNVESIDLVYNSIDYGEHFIELTYVKDAWDNYGTDTAYLYAVLGPNGESIPIIQ